MYRGFAGFRFRVVVSDAISYNESPKLGHSNIDPL